MVAADSVRFGSDTPFTRLQAPHRSLKSEHIGLAIAKGGALPCIRNGAPSPMVTTSMFLDALARHRVRAVSAERLQGRKVAV